METQEKIIESEQEILAAEKSILQEIKKEEKMILGIEKNIFIIGLSIALVVVGAAAGLLFWQMSSNEIKIDNSMISAPRIDLSAKSSGPLEEVFVNEGDQVLANAVLGRVGDELIKAKTAGIIVDVKKDIGQQFSAGTPVVSMIDPNELRVIGQLDENKGLSDIQVGQAAVFTVDAFDGQQFSGVVDEITPTSNDTGVVFSISDKREIKQFDIKIRFNIEAHPEFKNGM